MRRISLIGCCGTLLFAAGLTRAEDRPAAPVVSRGEEWLGEGSDLGLELAHVIAAGKKGNPGQARRDLELIATEAESRGLKAVWLEAQQWWVRFTLADQPDADLTPALEELLHRVQDWNQTGEEAEIYALWGEVLKNQGQWLMAVKAQDRATQLALDAGRVQRAVEAFLEMARLCREAGHGWRLHQVWVRLDQVMAARPVTLPDTLQESLVAERQAGAGLLARTKPAGPAGPLAAGVDLQPKDSRVMVSSPDKELGRSRFLLTNTGAFTVGGTLKVTANGAVVTAWQSGKAGLYITLGQGGTEPAVRPLRLLPGQQLEVYVEHGPGLAQDTVRVAWDGGEKPVTGSGTFYFTEGLPSASVVNAGVFQLHAGWSIPLYHEIYQRGRGARIQNLAVQASAACRLEIYDHDTGRLLAVDAEGDGAYSGPGDQVFGDSDRDGWPDLVVGDRARAIEICAWPLGLTGGGITVTAGLRTGPGGAGAANAVENTVLGPVMTAGRP